MISKNHQTGQWIIEGERQGLRFRFEIDKDCNLTSHALAPAPETVPPAFRCGSCGDDTEGLE